MMKMAIIFSFGNLSHVSLPVILSQYGQHVLWYFKKDKSIKNIYFISYSENKPSLQFNN